MIFDTLETTHTVRFVPTCCRCGKQYRNEPSDHFRPVIAFTDNGEGSVSRQAERHVLKNSASQFVPAGWTIWGSIYRLTCEDCGRPDDYNH